MKVFSFDNMGTSNSVIAREVRGKEVKGVKEGNLSKCSQLDIECFRHNIE